MKIKFTDIQVGDIVKALYEAEEKNDSEIILFCLKRVEANKDYRAFEALVLQDNDVHEESEYSPGRIVRWYFKEWSVVERLA